MPLGGFRVYEGMRVKRVKLVDGTELTGSFELAGTDGNPPSTGMLFVKGNGVVIPISSVLILYPEEEERRPSCLFPEEEVGNTLR